jgi:peptidoglycan/LPS O-acetylase OafA/YrhL
MFEGKTMAFILAILIIIGVFALAFAGQIKGGEAVATLIGFVGGVLSALLGKKISGPAAIAALISVSIAGCATLGTAIGTACNFIPRDKIAVELVGAVQRAACSAFDGETRQKCLAGKIEPNTDEIKITFGKTSVSVCVAK